MMGMIERGITREGIEGRETLQVMGMIKVKEMIEGVASEGNGRRGISSEGNESRRVAIEGNNRKGIC